MTTLARWEPFRDLLSLQRDMDRLFGAIGVPLSTRLEETTPALTLPSWDVIRRGDDLLVRAELPGVKPEHVDISVTDDILRIRGERHETREETEEDYLVKESSYGHFERTMRLPAGAPVDKIHAEYHDGILEVVIPKAAPESVKTHKIAVEVPEHKAIGGKKAH